MEEDIKILKELFFDDESYEPNGYVETYLHKEQQKAIENILNRLEQDEKVIEEMAGEIAMLNYEMIGAWCKDNKECNLNSNSCRGKEIECIIDYFRKNCE